ncbi:MAG TPA: hypothetical protein VFU47_04510 [Armatimonadota bacterium]|nr:hypothetical protein [Armatimonadota bacterium]
MSETRALPCTIFDHVVWLIQASDGSWRRGEIQLGECLMLFTSLDALHAFIDGCEDRQEAGLRPAVFSRNRKEFGHKAREAARRGLVGALFDPPPGTGEAPFLRFAKHSGN